MPTGESCERLAQVPAHLPTALGVSVRTIQSATLALPSVLLPLAMVGWFRPVIVIPAFLLAGLGFWSLVGPFRAPSVRARHVLALGAVVLVLVGFNARYSSQHLAVNRDPGLYSVLGTWVADEGNLLIEANESEWQGLPGRQDAGAAFYDLDRADGALYAQFSHLVPSTLAVADWAGGLRLMTRANAIISGAGLIMFFALAIQLIRPWPAVLATTGLGLNLIHLHVSRDTFSEPLAQLLLLVAVLELTRVWREGQTIHAALAGLALAAVWATRIDGVLLIATAGAVVAIWLVALAAGQPIVSYRGIAGFLGAWGVMASIAWLDLAWFTPRYLADLWSQTSQGLLLGVAAFSIGPLLAASYRFWAPIGTWWRSTSHRPEALAIAGSIIALWLIRPWVWEAHNAGNGLIPGLQARDGLAPEPTRSYAEDSVWWFSYYFGPWVIAGAIWGLYLATRRGLRTKGHVLVPVLLALGPVTLVYLIKPSISPDQLWAMRRFFPTGLPLLMILFGVAVDTLLLQLDNTRSQAVVFGAAGLALLAVPLSQVLPLRDMRTMRASVSEMEAVCDAIGDDGAVVLDTGSTAPTLTQSVRSICDVPTVGGLVVSSRELDRVAAAWEEAGRSLILLTGPIDADSIPGEVRAVLPFASRNLLRTLERAPDQVQTATSEIWVIEYQPSS
ncbi:MAG: hypothetical protein GY724_06580 [Actinomycetia bacterium]|nr:hypothetical protein [Actinomycetes bacterium]